MARKIEIEITGDTSGLERALSRGQKSAGNFEKGLKTASKGALVALGALGVGAVASVKAASDLEEQINKTSVVFRGSEDAIHNWSKSTASSFGISQRAALEAAGTFGNMLVPMGLARDKAGEMSRKMVELAADMASFNNADPTEVLESLRSGLAGETEPLRRFGVFLNEARIKEEALRLGLMKQGGTLSSAAKAQATYAIILEDTTDAQGDFANTSDSLANQQRILKAELENTGAALGQALLPAVTSAAGGLLDMVHVMQENETAAKILVGSVAGLSAGILVLRASVAIYTSTTLAAIGATKGLRLAMASTPWGAAAVLAGGLVALLLSHRDSASDAEGAQRGLTDALIAYQDAVRAGKDATIDLESAHLRLERAEINVKQAVLDRNKVDKDSTSTLLDRREADLRVAEAMNERRRAEQGVKDATKAGTDAQWDQNTASEKLAGSFGELTAKFQGNTSELQKVFVKGQGVGRMLVRVGDNTQAARDNAAEYADALRNMAAKAQASNPKLARTAELAADLAEAWGKVVSLPAAKEFVARFSVFTTVETNRQIPHGAQGGVVTQPTLALIGEAGPEAVVPLHRVNGASPLPAGRVGGNGGAGGLRGRYWIMADAEFVASLRELDGNERRRSGGRGIL